MNQPESNSALTPKEFAIEIVRRLQQAGYQSLWAGGCVRDQLVGRTPKDYDVATNATPKEVRQLFGHQRTIAIGAAFGVITVIGPKSAGNIEVATFRRDAEYSDGRRPDGVEFTDAREDAVRRDFTINGMFYDPIAEEVIDYVEGRADIDCRVIRAIGDPHDRIAEDKLRMLRAVRFAATFDFELEAETKAAVKQHAAEISAVSPERIGAEMRRMLAHPNRAIAAQLLAECQLLDHILEDGQTLYHNRGNWNTRLTWLKGLGSTGDFEQAASVMLSKLLKTQGTTPTAERWRLTNQEAKSIEWIETNSLTLTRAHLLPWSEVQPLLVHPDARRAVDLIAIQFGEHHPGLKVCRQKLKLPSEDLNPPLLVSGKELIAEGLTPGPDFSKIIQRVRDAQLNAEIATRAEGIALAKQIAGETDRGETDRGETDRGE